MTGRFLFPVFISLVAVAAGSEFQVQISRLRDDINEQADFLKSMKERLDDVIAPYEEMQRERDEMKELFRTKRHVFFPGPGMKYGAQPVLGKVVHTTQIPVGAPGRPGPRGNLGTPGHPGQRGNRGDKGQKGTPGIPGPRGAYGMPGVEGPSGESGFRGSKGEIGYTGYPGMRGDRGDEGLQGPNGQNGRVGFKGREGHFGPLGPFGWPGRKGDKGFQGPTGDNGYKGVDGYVGVRGAPGMTGPKGYAGPYGAPGGVGIPGSKGDRGDHGSPGENGVRGFPGPAYRSSLAMPHNKVYNSPAHPRYVYQPAAGVGKMSPPAMMQSKNGAPMLIQSAPKFAPAFPAATVSQYYRSMHRAQGHKSG